ncbi:PREDICTED: uncharacterized protein LOC108557980 [Nicrophorus vespilloides]|uniref:E3 SUMO-protein ligase NSE2 n=1 Tax=Nicrophorus vespilloides TaxID=110193 RepID=A0ABM1M6M6_NICVS|nr:PREDICTED: uncharacterized protein LOC108557980 [Nicrophorus vespilloides]
MLGTDVFSEKHEKMLNDCLDSLRTSSSLVNEYDDDNEEDNIEKMQNITKSFCDAEKEYEMSQIALEQTAEYFDNKEGLNTVDVREMYLKYLKDVDSSTSFTEHQIWKAIEGIIDPGQKSKKPDDCHDDSLICTTAFTVPIDPISKKVVMNPCVNSVCKHIYEFSVIIKYIQTKKKGNIRCPYIGCTNKHIQVKHLEKDPELELKIKNFRPSTSDCDCNTSITNISM